MPELELKPLPPAEAAAFWAAKKLAGIKEFNLAADAARLWMFAVSGIAKGDELATVYRAIEKTFHEGTTFEQFKRECGRIFERRGWTGKRAWRVDNIFRTNIQTAYNVGRYKQLDELAASFPYWRYSAVDDARTRPTHLALNGKVFPANHRFWDTWYPPNGFRCRCSVQALTAAQVRDQGIKVETKDPTNTLIEPIDPLTGNRTPAMQLLPDPGFHFHPGKAYWEPVTGTLSQRLTEWPERIAAPALAGMIEGPVFAQWYERPEGEFPMGRLKPESAARIQAATRTAHLSAPTAVKQRGAHPELTAAEYAQVQRAFDDGLEIQDGERSLVYILEEPGYVSVVKSTASGRKVFLTSFRRLSGEEARREREIARLLRKGERFEKK